MEIILGMDPDISPTFSTLFHERIDQLYSDVKNGTCVYDWNHDYTEEMRAVLKLYEEHAAEITWGYLNGPEASQTL